MCNTKLKILILIKSLVQIYYTTIYKLTTHVKGVKNALFAL